MMYCMTTSLISVSPRSLIDGAARTLCFRVVRRSVRTPRYGSRALLTGLLSTSSFDYCQSWFSCSVLMHVLCKPTTLSVCLTFHRPCSNLRNFSRLLFQQYCLWVLFVHFCDLLICRHNVAQFYLAKTEVIFIYRNVHRESKNKTPNSCP